MDRQFGYTAVGCHITIMSGFMDETPAWHCGFSVSKTYNDVLTKLGTWVQCTHPHIWRIHLNIDCRPGREYRICSDNYFNKIMVVFFSARRTLYQSKQCHRHLPTVFYWPKLSEDANVGAVFSDSGGDVGPPRADQTGTEHILVARPGHVGRGELCRHEIPDDRPRHQFRLVHIRLG